MNIIELKVFQIDFSTKHRLVGDIENYSYQDSCKVFVVTLDEKSAQEWWDRHYVPTFDGKNNILLKMSIQRINAALRSSFSIDDKIRDDFFATENKYKIV